MSPGKRSCSAFVILERSKVSSWVWDTPPWCAECHRAYTAHYPAGAATMWLANVRAASHSVLQPGLYHVTTPLPRQALRKSQ